MSDLAKKFAEKFLVDRVGPAAARHTRTPIEFTDNPMGFMGTLTGAAKNSVAQYQPTTAPLSIVSLLPGIHKSVDKPEGKILINPNSSEIGFDLDKLNRTVRHESIHALLDKQGYRSLQAARNAPGYERLANEVSRERGGFAPMEVPAYMGAFSNDEFPGVSNQERNSYIQGLVEQLNRLDPKLVEKFRRLAQ